MSREREVYDFIEAYVLSHGYPPTLDEIAAGVGITKTPARFHVLNMVERGILYREPYKTRALRIKQCYFEAGKE